LTNFAQRSHPDSGGFLLPNCRVRGENNRKNVGFFLA